MLSESTLDFENGTTYFSELLKNFTVGKILLLPDGINARTQLAHEKLMVQPELIDSTPNLLILRAVAPDGKICPQDRRKQAKVLGPYVNSQSSP
jgi:hypothetical protein